MCANFVYFVVTMKLYGFLLLLFSGRALSSVVSNVRLLDHTSYLIEVVTKTVNVVEQRGWCNLKMPDYVEQLNEDVLNSNVTGTATYTNGFLVSIQHVDIQQTTVQQVWFYNTTTQTTTVTVRGNLRMHDVAVGYDVNVQTQDGHHPYTATYTHPLIQFVFSIIKNVHDDTIEVTVVGTVPRTTLRPVFRPLDKTSDILSTMFDATTVTSAGINAWGPEIFEPIAVEKVKNEVEFPDVCYNCPV